MVCFVNFDLEMCFAPQRRALFRHRNFQQWSENRVRLVHFDFEMRFAHNGVQFFIAHLARWLRTRRFSEPTFRVYVCGCVCVCMCVCMYTCMRACMYIYFYIYIVI